MRNTLLILIATMLLLCFSTAISIAQSRPQPDNRLTVKFSASELKKMDAEMLTYWNFVVSNGYRIAKNYKTDSDMEQIELKDWDSPEFNILEHGLVPMEIYVQTFIIKGTENYIQILSENKIKARMK